MVQGRQDAPAAPLQAGAAAAQLPPHLVAGDDLTPLVADTPADVERDLQRDLVEHRDRHRQRAVDPPDGAGNTGVGQVAGGQRDAHAQGRATDHRHAADDRRIGDVLGREPEVLQDQREIDGAGLDLGPRDQVGDEDPSGVRITGHRRGQPEGQLAGVRRVGGRLVDAKAFGQVSQSFLQGRGHERLLSVSRGSCRDTGEGT